MKHTKKTNKYSIIGSLSIILAFTLNIIFENLIFSLIGLILSIVFFIKELKEL